MIIVTGANGNLGSQIVDQLLARVPAEEIGISVRDVRQASAFAELGVRVRAGDFTEPDSLVHAFEGAEQVLVVSASIRGSGAVQANLAAIDAARTAGAGRILYTSHQAASHDSLFAPQAVHAATEDHLAQQDVPFTALRNGFYASSLAIHLDSALRTGQIATPADGPVSWTAHRDLAEIAAIALTEPEVVNGLSPALTAPELLDLDAVADQLSEIIGRTIEHVVLSDEAWKEAAIERGMPPMVADFSLGMFLAARRGEFAVSDPTLERILGRPATSTRQVLETLVAQQTSRTPGA